MEPISLKTLLEAGCHFGHKADRWHPKASQFIYQERDGIHIIDLAKTKLGLEKAGEFLFNLGAENKKVLFVGTKRQAAAIIREEAKDTGISHLTMRWVGGFFTNWDQVHKNLEKIRQMTEEEKTGAWNKFPKHERVKLSRYVHKLLHVYGGVVNLLKPPDALVVVDIKREKVAVDEAIKVGMPVVGVVDTNADPSRIDYVIPSNDDAVGAIKCIINYLAQAYKEGLEKYQRETVLETKRVAKAAEKAAEAKDVKPEEKKAAAPAPIAEVKEVKKVLRQAQDKQEKPVKKVKSKKAEAPVK